MRLNSFPYHKDWCHSRSPSYSCGSLTGLFSCYIMLGLLSPLLGIQAYKIQRLQRKHNIAARVVAHPDHDHDIDEDLEFLHWLPVKYRILYKALMLVYKCLNNLATGYLSSILVPYTQEHYRYALQCNNLDLRLVPDSKHKTIGDRVFSYGAVVERTNSL